MAALTAGLYVTRNNRLVNLLTNAPVTINVLGGTQTVTVWQANLLKQDQTVDQAVQYQETGLTLPAADPPVNPLATLYQPATDVIDSNPFQWDIMLAVGTARLEQGSRG